jgi:hypothetical protein
MICPVLDKTFERLDEARAAHLGEAMCAEKMRCIWQIQAHASRGHDDKPCPGDWAQMYRFGQ